MKYYLIIFCIVIMLSLASAGFFLIKQPNKKTSHDHSHGQESPTQPNKRMAWALTARITLSVLLFASIGLFYFLGWIKPTGLPY
jgi:hypothetical protein